MGSPRGYLGWIAVLSVLAVSAVAVAGVIHVPADQPTIQAGVDAADVGDTVLVATGTYTGPGNRGVVIGFATVRLMSEEGSSATVIDCEGAGRAIYVAAGHDTTTAISGFTFRGGFHSYGGGAIYVDDSDPLIADCVFNDNHGGRGGAVRCETWGSPVIRACVFEGNDAVQGGAIGADYWASPRIKRCSFTSNTCTHEGGAVYADSPGYGAGIGDCVFVGNSSGSDGGAVYVDSHVTSPTGQGSAPPRLSTRDGINITGTEFLGNVADRFGGAVGIQVGIGPLSVGIVDCLFEENEASTGGAIDAGGETLIILRSDFARNSADHGGAVALGDNSYITIAECTLAHNASTAGAVIEGGRWDLAVHNCIIAYTTEGSAIDCSALDLDLEHCVLFENAGGDSLCGQSASNLVVDPLFCGAAVDDFTLCADSPCLPENNEWSELVGAHGEGCGSCAVVVERSSWGALKAGFR
jgi:predicted outer membrane repeat protein